MNIKCPCCDTLFEREEWYKTSNDENAICPKCSSYVDYSELKTDNEFYPV